MCPNDIMYNIWREEKLSSGEFQQINIERMMEIGKDHLASTIVEMIGKILKIFKGFQHL